MELHLGNCLNVLPTLAENSVDTVVTDPPYGLEFMGKDWDHGIPGVRFWQQVYRVLKPGAVLLAFGGTRTWHRLACAIEDAGFELRDTVCWLYGSGFPKSHDISKAIDKAAGAEREVVGIDTATRARKPNPHRWATGSHDITDGVTTDNRDARRDHERQLENLGIITAPATDAAALWDGWGTALKPAFEPVIVAMKPRDGTFANNALTWGVAGLAIDKGRVAIATEEREVIDNRSGKGWGTNQCAFGGRDDGRFTSHSAGRWPANLILSHSSPHVCEVCAGTGRIGRDQWMARTAQHGGSVEEWGRLSDGAANIECGACGGTGYAPGCRRIGTRRVKPLEGHRPNPVSVQSDGNIKFNQKPPGYQKISYTDEDGYEECAAWDCEPECPVRMLDEQSGESTSPQTVISGGKSTFQATGKAQAEIPCYGDTGGASRFFVNLPPDACRFRYQAKASKSERNAGLEEFEEQSTGHRSNLRCRKCGHQLQSGSPCQCDAPDWEEVKLRPMANFHPTIKPLALMRYLVRLTSTPTGGVVLDPFMGSGTTGMACVLEGRDFIGIEMDADYYAIAEARIAFAQAEADEEASKPSQPELL